MVTVGQTADPRGYLPAIHAVHLLDLCESLSVPRTRLAQLAGLQDVDLAAPGARIPLASVQRLVEHARSETREPALGYFMGEQMRVTVHGYLGLAAMTASTVGEALELAVRYAPTRTDTIALRLTTSNGQCTLTIDELIDLGSVRDVLLLALSIGLYRIGEALTGRTLDGHLRLAIPEPDYARRFEALSAGRIAFGAATNALLFDAADLALPLTMADPYAARLASDQCEEQLRSTPEASSPVVSLRRLFDAGDVSTAGDAASAMGLSERTLKRRLSEHGTTFSNELQQHRYRQAAALLREGRLTISEVGARVGYADTANFVRAFRRWSGKTPAAFARSVR